MKTGFAFTNRRGRQQLCVVNMAFCALHIWALLVEGMVSPRTCLFYLSLDCKSDGQPLFVVFMLLVCEELRVRAYISSRGKIRPYTKLGWLC